MSGMKQAAAATNMVDALSTLLKQVRLFGYDNSDLDPTLNPALDQGLTTNASSSSLSSQDSIFTQLEYTDSEYSQSLETSAGFSSTPSFSESFSTSYPEFKEDDLSDNSDVEDELAIDRRRRKTSKVAKDSLVLPEYTLNEVAQHDMFHDCWMVLYDKVYDMTQFLYEHPGGEELMMEHAGRDGTIAFRGVGHSKAAILSLQQYLVGVLPESERVFSTWETH